MKKGIAWTFATLALVALPFVFPDMAWIGRKSIAVEVHVIDAVNGRSVDGATVILRRRGELRGRISEDALNEDVERSVTVAGHARILHSFTTAGRSGLFTRRSVVYTDGYTVEVEHPSFESKYEPLRDFVVRGRSSDDTSPISCRISVHSRSMKQ
jgi:hypothetical protein